MNSPLKPLVERKLKAYFITGLLIVGPIGLTLAVIRAFVAWMDNWLYRLIPAAFHPDQFFGFPLPGLGLLAGLLLILLVGVLAANFLGRALVAFFDRIMYRIPIVKGIYTLFKQVADSILGGDRRGFRQVVLIEYPRKEIWSIGFVTGTCGKEIRRRTGRRLVNVFVPTTPNPTSGFYLLVPEADTIVLDMSVEEAFKLIVSGGMVSPSSEDADGMTDPASQPTPSES